MYLKIRFDFTSISVYFYLILIQILAVQAIKYYDESCNQSNTSVPTIAEMCDSRFICHQHRCKCRAGFGYLASINRCIEFDDFLCSEDTDCNGVDRNRLCNHKTDKCECNRFNGFYETKDKRLCKRRHTFLNQSCDSDNDCSNDYSYCKNSICKCWPEFEAQVDQLRVVSGQSLTPTHNCVRKICGDNSHCQTLDNPNLICNNTICECEYGFNLDSRRICVKMSRRQNCNITCQIIGGLFASIFMLSLIYWCFYCCYSIVKNYKMHNRNRNCINNNHIIEDSPQINRFIRRPSNLTHVHRSDQTVPINPRDERYYCCETETPPTYSQISDEPPDYETVVHMKANE